MKSKEVESNCCKASIRYLDCGGCKNDHKDCIYICDECGQEVETPKKGDIHNG